MLNSFSLTANPRIDLGTAASRRLRRLQGLVPAVLYGGGEPPLLLSVAHDPLWKALENPAFYSHILTITVDNITHQAVLKGLQRHPFKPRVLHFDLLRITTTEKIVLSVPLRFIGEAVAPGVKQEGGIVSHLLKNVELRCFPEYLPEFLEVDLSLCQLNETINLSQLQLPAHLELVALTQGEDRAVVSIHLPQKHKEGVDTENILPT